MSARSDDEATPMVRPVQQAEPGDHLCSFYASDDDQRPLVSAFVTCALGAGDARRVLAFSRWHDPRVEVDGL